MFYAQQPFHHLDYCWDGQITADKGRIIGCSLIEFNGHFGPGRERLVPLASPSWHWHASSANNRFGGIAVEVEGDPETVIHFITRAITTQFTVGSLIEQKLIRRHVGFRYSNVDLLIMFDGEDPNLDRPEHLLALTEADGLWRQILYASAFRGPIYRWYRADWAWAMPGKSVEVQIPKPSRGTLSESPGYFLHAVLRCVAAVPVEQGETLEQIIERGGVTPLKAVRRPSKINRVPYRVFLDEECISTGEQFFSYSSEIPLVEELHVDLPGYLLQSKPGVLRLQNDSENNYLLVGRLYLEEKLQRNLEVTLCPRWVLLGTEFEIAVTCRTEQRQLRVEIPAGVALLDAMPQTLPAGEHRFRCIIDRALANVAIVFLSTTCRCEAHIEQVVAVMQEPFPMRVGAEDLVLPAAHPGLREDVLRLLKDTQLGDYFVFREVLDEHQLSRWLAICRAYGIYYALQWSVKAEWARAAGVVSDPLFLGFQYHEFDGPTWGYRIQPRLLTPSVPAEQRTMRTAYQDYVAYWRGLVASCAAVDPKLLVAATISAVGHHPIYEAGVENCVTQYNKTHNVLLLADARGAARAHKRPWWGCYIAEGAHVSPEGEQHLRMWWLALHMAYVAGARYANDEEALWRTRHEGLYGRSDRVPRTRQQILSKFNRFTKTHPRQGELRVRQAILIGRYACDVVDGIATGDGIPPMVWRNFGANTPEWRPSTPEYGLRYLDVFFPGVWLQTLEQSPERVRRWYSGTPLGETELVSVDAPQEVLTQYALLLLLGWNTMDDAQYENLKTYVEDGGRLFMSVPHLTANESRAFLMANMEPLNLVKGGDFSDLFGIRVTGRGAGFRGAKAEEEITDNPVEGLAQSFSSAYSPTEGPQHAQVHLADIALCGAEVLAREIDSGQPLLVRQRLGKGEAYLLCTCDYPGNSWLSQFMTDLIRGLAEMTPSPIKLDDPSGDVYYTVREEEQTGITRIHLLNTDWTEAGNERHCQLSLGGQEIPLSIQEGRLSEVIWFSNLAVGVQDEGVYVESVSQSGEHYMVKLHGYGQRKVLLYNLNNRSFASFSFDGGCVKAANYGKWAVVDVDFGCKSVGELTVSIP